QESQIRGGIQGSLGQRVLQNHDSCGCNFRVEPLYSLKTFLLKVSGTTLSGKEEYKNAVCYSSWKISCDYDEYWSHTCNWISIVGTVNWLGGIIIGTMIGSNMVLEEHYKACPRNIVITGSTRGLGKALAREFFFLGIVLLLLLAELEENLKEGIRSANPTSGANMAHAKVFGIACDVCTPEDVERLANFAVKELGSIDIWINNAGTNQGFRPLLQFADEDIEQVFLFL
ncbi:hypothetical protein IFM89_028196, partial [Coptis chinensis]